MNNDEGIKNELQGSGFLEEIKRERLPDSEMLSSAAIKKYEDKYATLNPESISRDADRILRHLLEFEQEIYQERERRVYRRALVVFLKEKYDTGQTSLNSFSSSEIHEEEFTEYPNLQELFSELEEIYSAEESFEEAFEKILPLLYPAMDAISISAQQSRRKRAGSSLRIHIENLIAEADFTIENRVSAGNGHHYTLCNHNTGQSGQVYISFLTTLRDRFRQSLSNRSIADENVPRFIATGAGNNIFTSSTKSGVTDQKVNEIADEGFTLIVFGNIKQMNHQKKNSVISYSQFFAEKLPDSIG
jgi:hypothetical protein